MNKHKVYFGCISRYTKPKAIILDNEMEALIEQLVREKVALALKQSIGLSDKVVEPLVENTSTSSPISTTPSTSVVCSANISVSASPLETSTDKVTPSTSESSSTVSPTAPSLPSVSPSTTSSTTPSTVPTETLPISIPSLGPVLAACVVGKLLREGLKRESYRAPEPPRSDVLSNNIAQGAYTYKPIVVGHNGNAGPTGYTGAYGPTTQQEHIAIPSNLKGILGTWKGCIGSDLVHIRFEFTSSSKKLLAFFIPFTQPEPPFNNHTKPVSGPESLSKTVHYNCNSNTLLIEDGAFGAMTAWVVKDTIVGKTADGSQVNLVRDE